MVKQTNKFHLLLCLLVLTFSFSFGQFKNTQSKPGWVEHIPNRPDLLQGIGVAGDAGKPEKDQMLADNAAISQIINEISSTVSSTLAEYYEEKSDGSSVSVTETFTSISTHYAKETIKGIKVADRYYDKEKKLHYSYAYITHTDLDKQFREKAENTVKLCGDYHRYAQQATEDHNIYAALVNYGKALAELFIAQAFLKKKLEGDLDNNGRREMLQARLESEISGVLGKLYFQPVSGSGQKAHRNRGLSQPLIGKVIYRDSFETYPLPNIPITFKFLNATGDMTGKVLADMDGVFSGYVNLISSAEAENGIVKATIDLAEIEPFRREIPGLFHRLDEIGVNFNFRIDVAASVRIFVRIYEEIDGSQVRKSYATGSVIRSLLQNKFSVADIGHLSSGSSITDLDFAIQYGNDPLIATAVNDVADYAIVGFVISETAETAVGGSFVFASVDAEVRILDIQSGLVVATSVLSDVTEAGINASAANKSAIENCSDQMVAEIIEGLKKALQ